MTTVLLTGATGVVGGELLARLRARPDLAVVAVSRRGDAAREVLAWDLAGPALTALRRPFDVVVHAAADTRWNQPPAEAWRANVEGTGAVLALLDPAAHLIHVSTAFAIGLRGDTTSQDLADYRNSYEWSKAASERVAATHERTTIVRPPLVIGRRTDGHVERFSGLYILARALVTGFAPAFVADVDGHVEMVTVDDVADAILAVIDHTDAGGPTGTASPVVLGCGPHALTAEDLLTIACRSLNRWRAAVGAAAIDAPPIVSPERWERFFRPFVRDHLSDLQWRGIELLGEFTPYLSMAEPPTPTHVVGPVEDALDLAVDHWARCHPRLAASEPRPWTEAPSKGAAPRPVETDRSELQPALMRR